MPLRKNVLPQFQIQQKRHLIDQNAASSWPQECVPTGTVVFCDLLSAFFAESEIEEVHFSLVAFFTIYQKV